MVIYSIELKGICKGEKTKGEREKTEGKKNVLCRVEPLFNHGACIGLNNSFTKENLFLMILMYKYECMEQARLILLQFTVNTI